MQVKDVFCLLLPASGPKGHPTAWVPRYPQWQHCGGDDDILILESSTPEGSQHEVVRNDGASSRARL